MPHLLPWSSLTKQNKYKQEELQLMKTQDVKYLAMKERTEAEVRAGQRHDQIICVRLNVKLGVLSSSKSLPSIAQKVKRLKTSLHLIGMEPEGMRKHTVFVDSAAEARAFRPEEYFETPAELLGRAHNRPREGQLLEDGPGLAMAVATSGREARRLVKKAERWVRLS